MLTGKGRFIDDLEPVANIAHAAILRSPQAHAKIVSIDTSEAEEAPGVLGVLHRYSSTPIETYGVIADYDEAEDSFEKIVARTDIPKHRLTERVILYNRADLDARLMGR